MVKYTKHILMLLTSILVLSGCASEPDDTEDSQSTPAPIIKEVDSLDDADITIPAGLVGSEINISGQQEDQESGDTDDGGSGTATNSPGEIPSTENADGTITLSLNGEQRTAIVNRLTADIAKSIQTILDDDEYYPNIVSITPSEDGTTFTIALAEGQMNMYESMLVMSFYTMGDKFQLYQGIPASDVKTTVIYVNDSTGEVISESDSTSMETFTGK